MQKILIFGVPGSGKTTFSTQLSKQLGISVFHIDLHFFEKGPGWIKRPHEDFLSDVRNELKKTSWIIEGNGMKSLEMRFKEADVVFYFSFPLILCFYRIFRRAFAWQFLGLERLDCPDGAHHYVTMRLLKYMWNFSSRYTHKIEELKTLYPKVKFVKVSKLADIPSMSYSGTT